MPITSFTCPRLDQEPKIVPFDFCLYKCAPERQCLPLPLLIKFMDQREVKPGQFSCTESLNPEMAVHLKRTNALSVKPQDQIWMTFGTAWHKIMEDGESELEKLGLGGRYEFEGGPEKTDADGFKYRGFRVKVQTQHGQAVFTGRPDLYDRATQTLQDWKTSAVYSAKKVLEQGWTGDTNHHVQANIYRRFLYPDCTKIVINYILRDWHKRQHAEFLPVTQIKAPIIPNDTIDRLVRFNLGRHLAVEKGSKPKPCTNLQTWKEGRRCNGFCDVASICPDAPAWIEKAKRADEEAKKYRKVKR